MERSPGFVFRLDVCEHQRCAGYGQPPYHVLGNRAQSSGDQNRLAGKINAYHGRLPRSAAPFVRPSNLESTSCPASVTSTLSSMRAPPPRSETYTPGFSGKNQKSRVVIAKANVVARVMGEESRESWQRSCPLLMRQCDR